MHDADVNGRISHLAEMPGFNWLAYDARYMLYKRK